MSERVNQFLVDYTAVPHLRNPPKDVAEVQPLRDARHAACLRHAAQDFAATEFGRDACSHCKRKNYGASRCRVRGEGFSGHGVVVHSRYGGGPDFDFEHFPVGCHVSCTAPEFAGTVTHFDHRSGQHTLTLDDGAGERKEFLGYIWKRCTVTRTSRFYAAALHAAAA